MGIILLLCAFTLTITTVLIVLLFKIKSSIRNLESNHNKLVYDTRKIFIDLKIKENKRKANKRKLKLDDICGELDDD